MAVALYTMSKATYNFMANKIFKCSPTTVMNWIKKSAKEVEMPKICGDIKEIEFDEMWQVLNLVVGAMVSCFFLVDAQVILSIARAAAQGGAWCLTSDSSLLMTAVSVLFGTHLYGILQKAEARVFDVATFERICSAS
ncbi:MAG: hypothetical protein LBS23_00935 [Holosporaceae bacterium]|nr:hypothetical protein [Holosporaceae bacterium]